MANPKYLREGFGFCLSHAIEECGEFLAAAGKTQRWGLESVNPDLPSSQQEHNGIWLLREMDDVEFTLKRLRAKLADQGYESNPNCSTPSGGEKP